MTAPSEKVRTKAREAGCKPPPVRIVRFGSAEGSRFVDKKEKYLRRVVHEVWNRIPSAVRKVFADRVRAFSVLPADRQPWVNYSGDEVRLALPFEAEFWRDEPALRHLVVYVYCDLFVRRLIALAAGDGRVDEADPAGSESPAAELARIVETPEGRRNDAFGPRLAQAAELALGFGPEVGHTFDLAVALAPETHGHGDLDQELAEVFVVVRDRLLAEHDAGDSDE